MLRFGRDMKHFEVTSRIDAPPERVWEVLADAERWPEWDSGVIAVEGEAAPGNKVKITSEVNPKRSYPVKVSEFEPPRRMEWTGGMPLGLFTGVRTFELMPEEGGTRFRLREEFTGPLLKPIWRSMPDMQPSFEKFAAGLKAQAERPT
jgi:hypothetical protein